MKQYKTPQAGILIFATEDIMVGTSESQLFSFDDLLQLKLKSYEE